MYIRAAQMKKSFVRVRSENRVSVAFKAFLQGFISPEKQET